MIRTQTRRSHAHRRGAVLIVVLAMLVLFAVLGLSFVLYSEAQLSAARGQKLSVNQDTKPNPQLAAEGYLGGLIYDVGDTGDDLANPIRGHSLARSKYGYVTGGVTVLPFSAYAMSPESAFNWNGITDSRQVVRHTWDTGTNSVFDPERLHGGVYRNSPTAALTGTYQGKNYGFTYPDRHDYYLAYQDPRDGRITVPSFHRSDLGSWDPNSGVSYFENQGAAGKFRTLRPRVADGHTNFPPVPPNADGTYTGDVQNMTFTAGVQHNDSYWMDAGGPVLRWRGRNYKAMVAPLVLDLSSRVNLSVSGNVRPADPAVASGHPRHTSNMGFGPWEVNPTGLVSTGSMSNAELLALVRTRWPAAVTLPQVGSRPDSSPFETTLAGRLNNGLLPSVYSRLDPDGLTASATADAVTLPPPAGPIPFPAFPNSRYPDSAAAMTARNLYHPSLFNPFQHARGRDSSTGMNKAFGLDDALAHTARYSDPKGRHLRTEYAAAAPTAMADHFFRATTTPFSVSQQVPTAPIYTSPTTQVLLGPIDLNRPLTDYRRNPAQPHSPLNNWSPTAILEAPHFAKARQDRQALARDIFVRLAAQAYPDFGLLSAGGSFIVDGTGTRAAYNPATGYLTVGATPGTADYKALQRVAQVAANIVDHLDPDDVSTAFVWNPLPASLTAFPLDPALDPTTLVADRVVFGNELPKLVMNEVYSCVANTRDDPLNALQQAQRPLVRRHWIELHNPTPADATRPDLGSARLRYEQTVTQLPDPTTGTPVAYTGPTYNVYRIEVAESADVTPYTTHFSTDPVHSAVDTASVANMTLQVRIDTFTHDATAPSAAATLAGTPDELNLIRPLTGATGTNGSNNGYYVIGPRDQFPAGGVTNTLSLPDGGAPTAAAPVNALSYPVTPAAPAEADITGQLTRRNVFILRRLANPYLPFDAVSNPFITVDYVERMPVRDRATNNSTGVHTPAGNTASLGRRHPYAAAPTYDPTVASPTYGVNDQTAGGVNPPHTFFAPNSNITGTGFSMAWLKHLDRQVVNSTEQLYMQRYAPPLVTQNFYNGSYNDGNPHDSGGLEGWTTAENTFRLLTARSRMPGVPLGGREPGRLNLNTINDVRLLTAVFDPQGGNNIPLPGNPGYTGGFANDRWQLLFVPPAPVTPTGTNLVLRTPLQVPASTTAEGGHDCPFDGVYSSTGHLIRTSNNGSSGIGTRESYFVTGGDTYTAIDPLRKMWNSVTTTSDSLLLVMTVAFFEVENAGPWSVTNPPRFAGELFDKVSGDLRTKFAAVVDRSQLAVALDAATGQPQVGGTVADATPWQTALAEDAFSGTNTLTVEAAWTGTTGRVFVDGRPIDLPLNTPLRLGFGDGTLNASDGEPVSVTAVAQKLAPDGTGALTVAVPNRVTLTLSANLARPHGAGSPFGNGLLGNPGPQPGITLKQLQARGVVPYLTRLDP